MDSVPSHEYHAMFDRLTEDVDLEGATTGVRINNRLKVERHKCRTREKTAKITYMRKAYGFRAEEVDKLIEHDFAGRAIYEANRDPKGIIAQTLLYGREEARKRILAQKRAGHRMRYYRR